jgi:beta-glucosidase
VLKTGGPVLMPWLEKVAAVLEAWYPGEEDGHAVADLLFGKANPSGKLPMTFPKAEAEVPAHTPEQYPGVNGVATYSEKLDVGYRWYDAQNVEPLFPFGFGLSYTTFKLSGLTAVSSPSQPQAVELDIANTGSREGSDVVQVYVASPSSAGEPPKQLRGFARVELRAGEKRHISISLDPRTFSVWDINADGWKVIDGKYELLVGDSSRDLPLRKSLNHSEVNAGTASR